MLISYFTSTSEMLEKRTGANSEGWYDTPIRENVVGGAELHPSAEGKSCHYENAPTQYTVIFHNVP